MRWSLLAVLAVTVVAIGGCEPSDEQCLEYAEQYYNGEMSAEGYLGTGCGEGDY